MLHSFDHAYINDRVSINAGDLTDEQCMVRIQNGDETALATLAQRYRGLFRTIISRMINNDQDVDDLEQECLLEIWRHAASYNVEKGQAIGWLVTLLRRRTIDRMRRKSAYYRAQDRFRDESLVVAETALAGADQEAAQQDRAEVVSQLVSRLPAAQEQAVRLAFYRGMTQRQIAAHTGIPLGTIKTRLELALRKLRSAILAFGELHETR